MGNPYDAPSSAAPVKKKGLNPRTMTRKQKVMLLGIVAFVAIGVTLPMWEPVLGAGLSTTTTTTTTVGTSIATKSVTGNVTVSGTVIVQPELIVSTTTITNGTNTFTTWTTITTTTTTSTVP